MADVQKINSGSNIKRGSGVYYAGYTSTTTTPSVDQDDTILEVGAQNAGGNVANEWPCTTCIVTSDGVELSQNAAGCFVLPVDASGVAIAITTSGCVTGDGTVDAPIAIVLDPTGGLECAANGLALASDYVPNRGIEWLSDTSGPITVDWSDPPYNKGIRLLDDATLTFTDPDDAGPLVLVIDQGPTGGNIVTWPQISGSDPVLESGANNRTVINFFFDGDHYHV